MDQPLIDPHRAALFQALTDVKKEGLRRVVRWTYADGLPFATPYPTHQHTMPTVALGLLGVTRVVGKQTIDLTPGDMLVVEPGCWHCHEPQRPGSASFALGFLAGFSDVLFFDERETIWGAIPRNPMRDTVDRLIEATNEGIRLELADLLVSEVLSERISFVDWCHADVLAMAGYLWTHLHLEDFVVENTLRETAHGRTAGFALFRKFFGRSPRQELIHQRLELARHLVRRGLAITEAAARSGFRTRADLTRAHRLHYGYPPTESRTSTAPG